MVDKTFDPGLETLLDLDGEVFMVGRGYWTKIDACRVTPSKEVPHGIRYSLTLHDSSNQRVLGFDNAHGIKPKRKKFGARKVTWDHKHSGVNVENYEFESAGQLMEDFWAAVNEIVK